tara:strand:- start:204 stop:491 length:288 start_codon:yes stop_codon:yes gene_type:complete
MKLSNEEKADLALAVMHAVDEMFERYETEDIGIPWPGELAYLAETAEGVYAMKELAAKWLARLPGKRWVYGLPEVWSKSYEAPAFDHNGEYNEYP